MANLDAFHYFNRLPFELRMMIWEAAIRPARKGAHTLVFKWEYPHIYFGGNPEDIHIPCIKPIPRSPTPAGHETTRAQPEIFITLPKDRNLSASLIDGGLWTACKESRAVINKVFQGKKWIDFRKFWVATADLSVEGSVSDVEARKRAPDSCFPWGLPLTGRVSNSNHYFTVFPGDDLFILDIESVSTFGWEVFESKSHYSSYINLQEPLQRAKRPYICWLDLRIRHVAVTYHPGQSRWKLFYQLTCTTFTQYLVASLDVLYIIDPTLKRRPKQVASGTEASDVGAREDFAYYHGKSLYIEIDQRFNDHGLNPAEPEWEGEHHNPESTSSHFLCWERFEQDLQREWAKTIGRSGYRPYVHLLAVENL